MISISSWSLNVTAQVDALALCLYERTDHARDLQFQKLTKTSNSVVTAGLSLSLVRRSMDRFTVFGLSMLFNLILSLHVPTFLQKYHGLMISFVVYYS
jgi:hypothetical protein